MSAQFQLQAALSPERRIDELCRFIEFWLGRRQRSYGVPAAALKRVRLPAPLRKLHAFAGRWPRRVPIPRDPQWNHAFAWQNCLRPIEHLEYDAEDRVTFLHENQGVWELRTPAAGDDPPVWQFGDAVPDGRMIADSLSEALVNCVLQELLFGSAVCLDEDKLRNAASSLTAQADELWSWPHGSDTPAFRFRLGGTVLIGDLGARWFATNDQSALSGGQYRSS